MRRPGSWVRSRAVVAPSHASLRSWYRRLPTISARAFRPFAVTSLVMMCLIVATGAAVRLSGSGLGCPDWPTCYRTRVTAQLSFHPLMEFGNRLVTVLLVVVVGATMLAALRRTPARRDLNWLSLGLVAGVFLQAGLGALVVYTKLNPYLVMVHFLATMVLVADAVVLVHRSSREYRTDPGRRRAPPAMLWLSRGLMVMLTVVLAAGTATTGAGPHRGNASGQQIAARIPVAFRDLAELHATLALFLVGATIATVMALHALDVPERVRRGGRILVMVMVAQAGVGYAQYFTHVPVVLVEIHIVGATSLVVGMVLFHLGLTHHRAERVDALVEPDGDRATELARIPDPAGVPDPAGAVAAGIGGRAHRAPW